MTQPTHPHLSDEQKADAWQSRVFWDGCAFNEPGWGAWRECQNPTETTLTREKNLGIKREYRALVVATPPAAAEAPAVRDALQALVDLRGHGSWSGKWFEAWNNAYAALSALPKADSTEPKCNLCGYPGCSSLCPNNYPASAQAGELSDREIASVFEQRRHIVHDIALARAILALRPKAQPLTDEQIMRALNLHGGVSDLTRNMVRAIEAAHGIASPTKGEGS